MENSKPLWPFCFWIFTVKVSAFLSKAGRKVNAIGFWGMYTLLEITT